MTPAEMQVEMIRLSGLINSGIDSMREGAERAARAEMEYRKGRAQAWVSTDSNLLAAHRLAEVDARTAELRYERDLAEDMRVTAREAVRARRAQLSALQSLMSAHRAEAEFTRTQPRETIT